MKPDKIMVYQWNIGVPYLDLTSTIDYEPKKTSQVEPSPPSGPLKLAVEAGSGVILITMKIDWPEGQKSSAPAGTVEIKFPVPYQCILEGDPEALPPGNDFKLPKPGVANYQPRMFNAPMSVAVEVYFWKEHPNDFPKTFVPTEVMHDWMKQLNMLHIVANTTVTLAEEGEGSFSLEYKDESVAVPTFTAGPTVQRTARFHPVEIILDPIGMPPPITTAQGSLKRVYFDVDSFDINKIVKEPGGTIRHQAEALDEWIKDVLSRWEVIAALFDEKVPAPLRLEARASATYKGMSEKDLSKNALLLLKAKEYNQNLSEKRKRAAVDRLIQTIRGQHLSAELVEGKNLKATAAAITDSAALRPLP